MDSLTMHLARRAFNDVLAFAELYDRFYKRVYTYVRYRCSDADTADDLASEVFECVLSHQGQYCADLGPFEPWLFAIARNVVNTHYRRQRFRWMSLDVLRQHPASDKSPEEAVVLKERERLLLDAIGHLDRRSRDVLGLKFAASLSTEEIAVLTGLSPANTRVVLYRAVRKLRELIGDEELGGYRHA